MAGGTRNRRHVQEILERSRQKTAAARPRYALDGIAPGLRSGVTQYADQFRVAPPYDPLAFQGMPSIEDAQRSSDEAFAEAEAGYAQIDRDARDRMNPMGAITSPFVNMALDPERRASVGAAAGRAGDWLADVGQGIGDYFGRGDAARDAGNALQGAPDAIANLPSTVSREAPRAAGGALNAIGQGIDWVSNQANPEIFEEPDFIGGVGSLALEYGDDVLRGVTYGPWENERAAQHELDLARARADRGLEGGQESIRPAADAANVETAYAGLNAGFAPLDVPALANWGREVLGGVGAGVSTVSRATRLPENAPRTPFEGLPGGERSAPIEVEASQVDPLADDVEQPTFTVRRPTAAAQDEFAEQGLLHEPADATSPDTDIYHFRYQDQRGAPSHIAVGVRREGPEPDAWADIRFEDMTSANRASPLDADEVFQRQDGRFSAQQVDGIVDRTLAAVRAHARENANRGFSVTGADPVLQRKWQQVASRMRRGELDPIEGYSIPEIRDGEIIMERLDGAAPTAGAPVRRLEPGADPLREVENMPLLGTALTAGAATGAGIDYLSDGDFDFGEEAAAAALVGVGGRGLRGGKGPRRPRRPAQVGNDALNANPQRVATEAGTNPQPTMRVRDGSGPIGNEAFHDPRLTPQQNRVVGMARNGMTNRQIADEELIDLAQVSVVFNGARKRAPDVEIPPAPKGNPGYNPRTGEPTATIQEIVKLRDKLVSEGYAPRAGPAGGESLYQVIGERLGISAKSVGMRLRAFDARNSDPLTGIALGTGIGAGGYALLSDEAGAEEGGQALEDGRAIETLPEGVDLREGEFMEPWRKTRLSDGSEALTRTITTEDGHVFNLIARQNADASIDVLGYVRPEPTQGGTHTPIGGGGERNPPTDWSLDPAEPQIRPYVEEGAGFDPLQRVGAAAMGALLARGLVPRGAPIMRSVAAGSGALMADAATGGDPVEAFGLAAGGVVGSRLLSDLGPIASNAIGRNDMRVARDRALEEAAQGPEFEARRDAFAATLSADAPRTRNIEANQANALDGRFLIPREEVVEQGFATERVGTQASPREQFLRVSPAEQLEWMDHPSFGAPLRGVDSGTIGVTRGPPRPTPPPPTPEPIAGGNPFYDASGKPVFGSRPRKPAAQRPPLAERAATGGTAGAMQGVSVRTLREIADDLDIETQGVKAAELRRSLIRNLADRFDSTRELVSFLARYGVPATALGFLAHDQLDPLAGVAR